MENMRKEFQQPEFPGCLFQCPHDQEMPARMLEKDYPDANRHEQTHVHDNQRTTQASHYILFELRASCPAHYIDHED